MPSNPCFLPTPSSLCSLRSLPLPKLSSRPPMEMSLSRRNLLQALPLALLPFLPARARAYSSTYAPSRAAGGGDVPDAPRLYDSRGIITTASGLRYFDLSVGDGDGPIAPGDAVVCSYTMRLGGLNGTKLDSSFDKGEDLRFVVGDKNVVPGVNEMVIGMRVDGKRRAVVPPELGYKSANNLPAITEFFAKRRLDSVLNTNRDATIVVDVEILRIKR